MRIFYHERAPFASVFLCENEDFTCARYDVLFIVFASMPSEQTCLQGFASDGIHKALAFLIKNAKNESFNAQALSAE